MLSGIKRLGFTMIELLVVIAVIGILAVALLSTLNPLEQIRKGRDTRTRTDLAQLLGGIERYNASIGYFPWQLSVGEDVLTTGADIDFYQIGGPGGPDTVARTTGTAETLDVVLDRLTTTSEVKAAFVDRITGAGYATTYLFYDDEAIGGTVIACFTPESQSFQKEAFDRCKLGATGFSTEFAATAFSGTGPCPDGAETVYTASGYAFSATDADEMICLP
jgi:prepilin-type N-terminal cleavage/methylation domain-containing protein